MENSITIDTKCACVDPDSNLFINNSCSCIFVQYDIQLIRIEEKLLHYYMSSSFICYISHINTLFQGLGPVQCFQDKTQLQTQKLVKQS